MSVVLSVRAGDDAQLSRLHRAFHLAAGVDELTGPEARPRTGDWLIESEPNEFWWPRSGSLRETVQRVPDGVDVVEAVTRLLVGSDHMYRVREWGAVGRKRISRVGGGDRALRGWYPIEVLVVTGEAVDDRELVGALAAGTIVEDTRLRDALAASERGVAPTFAPPSILDDAQLAGDVAALGDADIVAARRRLDELEERVAAVESLVPLRLERALRTILRRHRR